MRECDDIVFIYFFSPPAIRKTDNARNHSDSEYAQTSRDLTNMDRNLKFNFIHVRLDNLLLEKGEASSDLAKGATILGSQ